MARTPLDIAVVLPGVGVFGGVRRFIAIGNELVRRGHRFVIYHPTGEAPAWLTFHGETRPTSALAGSAHQVLMCNNPPQLEEFERAKADLKLFYFALEGIPGERRIARRKDWVAVVNSSGLHRRLWRRYRVDAERAVGGIDLEAFQPAQASPPPGDEFRALVFGRTSRRRKGTMLAIKAVERAAARTGKRVRLVLFDHVAADDPSSAGDRIRSGVPVQVHMNPTQEELASIYRGCHVFVSAERRAGWSNTVAEAMACGTPVVCTQSGTVDIALAGETAWVTRLRHPWTLARGVCALQESPETALALRRRALERIRDYTWSRVTDSIEEIVSRRLR